VHNPASANYGKVFKCFNCDDEGHMKPQCPKPIVEKYEEGHFASNCPKSNTNKTNSPYPIACLSRGGGREKEGRKSEANRGGKQARPTSTNKPRKPDGAQNPKYKKREKME
jgi:Zinc knuckle